MSRKDFASRTTCRLGHPWTPENTKIGSKGERVCRTCLREHQRIRRAGGSIGYRRYNTLDDVPALLDANHYDDPATGCRIWTGAPDGKGYGKIRIQGKQWQVHRLAAWLYLNIPLNDQRVIRHSCDNPPCFAAEHLLPGTYADNSQDAIARGRYRNGRTILSAEDVTAIRQSLIAGVTQQALADAYGVKRSTISKIATGRTWKNRG